MYNIIKQNTNTFTNNDYTLIDLLPKKEETTMKNELKNFLKKQLNTSSNDLETNLSNIDSITNTNTNINSFSFYTK